MPTDMTDGAEDWWQLGLRPLGGGYSGETFLAGDGASKAVVRVYARNPERAAIDASLLRLVRGLLPVPEVLELRHWTASTPAVLVTEYVAGTRLDLVLAEQGQRPIDLPALGRSIARVLNTLAGMPFLRPGMFVDASLAVSADGLPTDVKDYARRLRADGRLATWAEPDWRALLDVLDLAEQHIEMAGAIPVWTALAHGDFNAKNILVDRDTSEVTALVDWEFAHAGSLYTDLGNFARFERSPDLIEPLLAHLVHPRSVMAADRLRLARAADLWSLLDFAGGSRVNAVQALATELLLAQARTDDLDAWPWRAERVDPSSGAVI